MSYIPWVDFKDYTKDLPIGDSGYFPHAGCTESNKMWVVNSNAGFTAFCNKCGDKGFKSKGIRHISELSLNKKQETESFRKKVELPDDFDKEVKNWLPEAKLWLYSSDIRNKHIEDYGIGYSKSMHRVILPIYNEEGELLMWQGRGLTEDQTKYYNVFGYGRNTLFFKSWVKQCDVCTPNNDIVVVTEDILSAIRVGEFVPTVSSLGTSLSTSQINTLSNFKRVVIWYDDDKGGKEGIIKGLRKLDMLTEVVSLRTTLDPKKLCKEEILSVLADYL